MLLLLLTVALADPQPQGQSDGVPPADIEPEAPSGPTEVMLLYGDVNSTVQVAGIKTTVPSNVQLPMGTHEARITTSNGQLIVKIIDVRAPSENTQVIDLGTARAASVPGHTFRFEVKGDAEGMLVFVDGIEGGPPPLDVLLSPGPHIVELQKPDGTRTGGETMLTPEGEGPTVVPLTP